jgi:hypothetical protein
MTLARECLGWVLFAGGVCLGLWAVVGLCFPYKREE